MKTVYSIIPGTQEDFSTEHRNFCRHSTLNWFVHLYFFAFGILSLLPFSHNMISFKHRYLLPESIKDARNVAIITLVCEDSDFLFDTVMAISNIFRQNILKKLVL
jgi:hypothetical protein